MKTIENTIIKGADCTALLSVLRDSYTLEQHPELNNNKALALILVHSHGLSLEYVSPELQDDEDVVIAAVRQNGFAIAFASERLKHKANVLNVAVKENPFSYVIANKDRKRDVTNFLHCAS